MIRARGRGKITFEANINQPLTRFVSKNIRARPNRMYLPSSICELRIPLNATRRLNMDKSGHIHLRYYLLCPTPNE